VTKEKELFDSRNFIVQRCALEPKENSNKINCSKIIDFINQIQPIGNTLQTCFDYTMGLVVLLKISMQTKTSSLANKYQEQVHVVYSFDMQ
jgi:hypothetical protein